MTHETFNNIVSELQLTSRQDAVTRYIGNMTKAIKCKFILGNGELEDGFVEVCTSEEYPYIIINCDLSNIDSVFFEELPPERQAYISAHWDDPYMDWHK